MQQAISQTVEFVQATLVKPNINFTKADEVQDSTSDLKSFESLVNEARQTSENNASSKESEISQNSEKIASKSDEKIENNDKAAVKTDESVSEKKQKIDDVKQKNEKQVCLNIKETDTESQSKTVKKPSKEVDASLSQKKNETKTNVDDSFEKISSLIKKSENQKLNESSAKKIKEEKKENSVDDSMIIQNHSETVLLNKVEISQEKSSSNDDEKNLDFLKKNDKKISKLDKDGKITVEDLRTENKETEPKEENKLKISDVKYEKNTAEISIEVASNTVQDNVLSSNDQAASANGSNFQAMLSNQIQENAGELVKAGNIVLKDNDVGSIKLILHPESLGNVKIDLQINEKNIIGKIIVQSQEAMDAFKESVENLKQAFIENGYENAGLELSFAGQNSSGNNFNGNNDNYYFNNEIASAYGEVISDEDSSEFDFENNFENSERNSINIVA